MRYSIAELKSYLASEGYSVSTEQYADLAQGSTAGHSKSFYSGNKYVIVAISEDGDVTDIDIYLYRADGSEYSKDASSSKVAILEFEPTFSREMRVVIKNYASNTPYYKSRCKFLIFYK